MPPDFKRNPVIIPETDDKRPSGPAGCPKCKGADFGGRRVNGVVTYTCKSCGNQWAGGRFPDLPDPRNPIPPQNPNDRPLVSFSINKHGAVTEHRRPVPLTQEFRKGSKIPDPGEEDV